MRSASLALVLVSVLLAAACHGKHPATTTGTGNTGGKPAAGPPYLAVFQDGKQLRYKRVHETSEYNPDDPAADANGQLKTHDESVVACTIVAHKLGAWQVASLACKPEKADDEGDDLLGKLATVYVADARGIWRAEASTDLPKAEDEVAAIAQGEPLLAASPTPVENKKDDSSAEGAGEGEFGSVHKISQDPHGAWCIDDDSWGGDEGGEGICFTAGKGVTKVSTYFAGGSTHDDWYELIE